MNSKATRPLFVSLLYARPFNETVLSNQFRDALEEYFVTDASQLQLVRCQKRNDHTVMIDFMVDPLVFCRRLCVYTGPLRLTLANETRYEFAIGISEHGTITYYHDVRHLAYWSHLSFDLLQEAMESACRLVTSLH